MKNSLILALCFVLIFSCVHVNKKNSSVKRDSNYGNSNAHQGTHTTAEYQGIVNKYWKLKTLQGQIVKMTTYQEREQYFILKTDGTMNGFLGCNTFTGTYELNNGNRILFKENIAVTMKICPDITAQETEFLEVYKLANNFTISGDTLTLNVGRLAPLAVFEAVYF